MTDEKRHDIWNRCGHPNILDNRPLPTRPFQGTIITTKELAESRCACCNGELVILISQNTITTFGVCATIGCPTCTDAEFTKIESERINQEVKIFERNIESIIGTRVKK